MSDSNDIEYTLRVRADSQSGTQQFAQDFQSAAQSADQAAQSVNATIQAQGKWFDQTTQSIIKNSQAQNTAVTSAAALEKQYNTLMGQMDPLVSKTQQYIDRMTLLDQALAKGVITSQSHAAASKQVSDALDKASGSTTGFGLSSTFALTKAHALMDELASGRTRQFEGTLTNVAAQLVQTSGFMGAATVAAVALAAGFVAVAVSVASYESEIRDVDTALAGHNNLMGLSGATALQVAQDVSTVSHNSDQTTLSIIKMGAAMNVTATQMAQIATIASPFAALTGGKDAEAGAASIEKYLTGDSLTALMKIEEAFHNVTQADVEYMTQLQSSGATVQEHQLLIDKLTEAAKTQASGVTDTGNSWAAMKQSLSDNWDQMRRYLSGNESLTDQVATAHQNLINYQGQEKDAVAAGGDQYEIYTETVAKLQDQYDGLLAKLAETPGALAAVAMAAMAAGDQLAIVGQQMANATNPNFAKANSLTNKMNTIGYGIDGKPGANMNDAYTVDDWKKSLDAEGSLGAQRAAITNGNGDAVTPGQLMLQRSRQEVQIKGITDPQQRAAAQARMTAQQQGQAAGLYGDDLNEYVNNQSTSASEAHAPKPKKQGRGQHDLTKGVDQKNQDEVALAGAYGSGNEDDIQKQLALNDALEKSTYNTGTSIDKLKQSYLDQHAALADMQGAQILYNETLKATTAAADTAAFANGGTAGLDQQKLQDQANSQYDSKIAAARAANNQTLITAIQLEKEHYIAQEQSIQASQQQLQVLQMEASNNEQLKTSQVAMSGMGMTQTEQDNLNNSVKVYYQLQQMGMQEGTTAYQEAYTALLQQDNLISKTNQDLKDAQTKQADYKSEVDQFGNALGDAFYNGIIAGQGLQATFSNLLASMAKMIFQMEVMKPLMDSLNQSSAGSGGVITGLFGKLFGSAGAASAAGEGGAEVGGAISGWGGAVTALAHSGDIAGWGSVGSRSVDMNMFSTAKRYHTGGIVDGEVPIVAQQGEAVMPTVRMADGTLGIKSTGGGGATALSVAAPVNLTINYQASGSGMSHGDMNDMSNQLTDHVQSVMDDRIQKWALDQVRPGGVLSGSQKNRMGG